MKNYREGVSVVALSWGWDIVGIKSEKHGVKQSEEHRVKQSEEHREQRWRGWNTRLKRMTSSLYLFGVFDLLWKLYPFIKERSLREMLSQEVQDDYDAWLS